MHFFKSFYNLIVILVLLLWISISIARVSFNIARSFTTEREWFEMSDDQKRTRLLGQEHNFLNHIEKVIPINSRVLVLLPTQDILPGIFYKTIYYLYPRELVFINYINKANLPDFDYIVSYSNDSLRLELTIENVEKIHETNINNINSSLYKHE